MAGSLELGPWVDGTGKVLRLTAFLTGSIRWLLRRAANRSEAMSSITQSKPVQRRSNVVLSGEPGAGKSALVNLIAGSDHDVAKTGSSISPYTFDARPYDVSVQGRPFRIFDTVGFNAELFRDPDHAIGTISKAYRFVRCLTDTGGVHLIVLCMRGDRLNDVMWQNYVLFRDVLCHGKVPVVLVVTHLEHEKILDDWWIRNWSRFEALGIVVCGYACITTKREFGDIYRRSRRLVHDLLIAHGRGVGFVQQRVHWLTELFRSLLDQNAEFLMRSDSLKLVQGRAHELREYGMRGDEIAALVAVVRQARKDADASGASHARGNTQIEIRATTTPITTDEEDAPPIQSKTSIVPEKEAPRFEHETTFPNDLTGQVTRESHDPVASGGFADIHRGILRSNAMSIKVAIKAIRTYSGDDDSVDKKQKRLRREIKVWLSLRHDNVLPLLGLTTGFGRFPAMVCPWADNGTLTTYLGACHATLSSSQLLGLLDNVACGLRYLHSRSIVHGDLTGSNILVSEDGNAYIADFGLSTLLTELGGATFATSFHARGTIRWIAPELLDLEVSAGEGVLPTTWSDVYSFGGVMLQILSGKVPYHYYATDMQVVLAVSRGMKPSRPVGVLVTDRRWAFVERCWDTVDGGRVRPTSEELVNFTRGELGGVHLS